MNDQLEKLLVVRQENDYTWMALLPEMAMMWTTGHSERQARENWLQQYGSFVSLMLDSLLQERAKHPVNVEACPPLQRPTTVDFPYRSKLYRIATNEGLPKRHIILPDGTILVVCGWTGRVPSTLADIRRSSELPETIATQLDGTLAKEIPLLPGQTTHPMAILDFEGQRYAIKYVPDALVELPDGRLYRIEEIYLEEPVRVAKVILFDANHSYMPYQLQRFGKTPAIPVASDYAGMASEPRDLRIRFVVQGERFILSHEAYEQRKRIVFVPGHGYYRIGIYLHSMPIQLGELLLLPLHDYHPNDVAAALRYADAVGPSLETQREHQSSEEEEVNHAD